MPCESLKFMLDVWWYGIFDMCISSCILWTDGRTLWTILNVYHRFDVYIEMNSALLMIILYCIIIGIHLHLYSLNACHLDLPLLEFWSWHPLCSNNSGLRLFAKKRLQQKQRSRHASASFKWGISRIQPAKMLLGPPCAWPDQCRENGRAYRDGWRDGSCNVLHCSTSLDHGWVGALCWH